MVQVRSILENVIASLFSLQIEEMQEHYYRLRGLDPRNMTFWQDREKEEQEVETKEKQEVLA